MHFYLIMWFLCRFLKYFIELLISKTIFSLLVFRKELIIGWKKEKNVQLWSKKFSAFILWSKHQCLVNIKKWLVDNVLFNTGDYNIIINLILAYWNRGVGAMYVHQQPCTPATKSLQQVFSLLSAHLFQNPKEYLLLNRKHCMLMKLWLFLCSISYILLNSQLSWWAFVLSKNKPKSLLWVFLLLSLFLLFGS